MRTSLQGCLLSFVLAWTLLPLAAEVGADGTWRVVEVSGHVETRCDPFQEWTRINVADELSPDCLIQIRKGSLKLAREGHSFLAGANSVLKLSEDRGQPRVHQRWGTVLYDAVPQAPHPLVVTAPLLAASSHDGTILVSVEKSLVSVTAPGASVALEYGWDHEVLQLGGGQSAHVDERGRRVNSKPDDPVHEIETIVQKHRGVFERLQAVATNGSAKPAVHVLERRSPPSTRSRPPELPAGRRWPRPSDNLLVFYDTDPYEQHADDRVTQRQEHEGEEGPEKDPLEDGGTLEDDGGDRKDDHSGDHDDRDSDDDSLVGDDDDGGGHDSDDDHGGGDDRGDDDHDSDDDHGGGDDRGEDDHDSDDDHGDGDDRGDDDHDSDDDHGGEDDRGDDDHDSDDDHGGGDD